MGAKLFLLLYLLRDTLHRWCTRISSPLARLLVVLTLSFCGLVFLSNYALSIRMLEEKLLHSGADLLVVGEYIAGKNNIVGEGHCMFSTEPDECELYQFNDLFVSAKANNSTYSVVEYMPELIKQLPLTDNVIYLLPNEPTPHNSPVILDIEGYRLKGVTLSEKQAGFLRKLYRSGAIFIPQGSFSLSSLSPGMVKKHVLRFQRLNVQTITRWEQMFNLLSRLDQRNMTIVSSRKMLQDLEQLKQLQYQFRLGIVLGCCCVIGLLLTSISSMEFRQNEYVYALMGSFGISRISLFLTFVAENSLLVFGGFTIAMLSLANTGQYLVDKLYHMNNYAFSLDILRDDIRIFVIAFLICIPVSCIPILGAIFRPIGKILK